MALTKYLRISMYCLVATLAMTSCAKKNDALLARQNAAGAKDISQPTSQAADDAAKAAGFETDFINFSNPTANGNGLSVVTRISVNKQLFDITTVHNSFGANSAPAMATQTIAGGTFAVNAVCGNQYCNPYYIIINVSANGREVKQMAQMKYFYYTDASSQSDVFYSRGAGQFMTVPQAINALTAGSQQAAATTP